MANVEQFDQETSSIRTYVYMLILIVLIVTSGTAGFLIWMDLQSQETIQISNKFHVATIVHVNNVKHDLQQMESLLLHEDNVDEASASEEAIPFPPGIDAHLSRINKNISSIIQLEEQYGGEKFQKAISRRLSKRFNQFKSDVASGLSKTSQNVNSIRTVFRPMHITLLQLESLHLTVNSENLKAYRQQRGGIINNFLGLVAVILIVCLFVVARALSKINRILKERAEDRLSIKEQNLFLSSILESSSKISIIATDLKGVITYWNKGAELMFEYTSEEMVGKQSVNILYPEGTDTKGVTAGASSRILRDEESSFTCEVQEKTKSGKIIWINLEISKRLSVDSKLEGILGIGSDITDRKNLEQGLKSGGTQ